MTNETNIELPGGISSGPSSDGLSNKGTLLRCPQQWAYWRLLGIVPSQEPRGRGKGSLVHTATMWRHLKIQGVPWAQSADPVEMMRRMPRRYMKWLDQAIALYDAYVAHWTDDAHTLRILSVEREHAIDIDGSKWGLAPVRHSQRMDLVVESGGKAWVWDTKTSYGSLEASVREWSVSAQFALLEVIGRSVFHLPPPVGYGMPFGGLMLNFVHNTEPFSFARREVKVAPGYIAGALDSMVWAAKQRQDLQRAGLDPWAYPRNEQACADSRYGWCDYVDLCAYGRAMLETGRYEHDEEITRWQHAG